MNRFSLFLNTLYGLLHVHKPLLFTSSRKSVINNLQCINIYVHFKHNSMLPPRPYIYFVLTSRDDKIYMNNKGAHLKKIIHPANKVIKICLILDPDVVSNQTLNMDSGHSFTKDPELKVKSHVSFV